MTNEGFIAEMTKAAVEIQEIHTRAVKVAQENLKPALIEFITKYPEIRAFAWTQYAPYFNDGEPCVFSVHDLMFLPATVSEETLSNEDLTVNEIEENGGFYFWTYGDKRTTKKDLAEKAKEAGLSIETVQACDDLNHMITSIGEDILEEVFGSDAQIIVADGDVDVQDYSSNHD